MRSASSISSEPTGARRIKGALEGVLDGAMRMGGGSGSARPWMALIVARDVSFESSHIPQLPWC
jgi:hypothetical protein